MSIQDYHLKIRSLSSANDPELNKILDEINSISCIDISNYKENVGELLCDTAKLLSSSNDHILSKFCSLVYFLLNKQKVTLCLSSFKFLINFLSCKLSSCGSWVQSDVLIALTALLSNENQLTIENVNSFFTEGSIFMHLLVDQEEDKLIQYNAFLFLFALIKNLGENGLLLEKLDLCSQICLTTLKRSKPCHLTEVLDAKILLSSLKCLQLIFSSKNATVKNVGEVLGTLKSFLFYGLPGESFASGSNLMPSLPYVEAPCFQESQSESEASYPKVRKLKKSRRTKKTHKTRPQNDPEKQAIIENTSNKVTDLLDDANDFSAFPAPTKSFKDIRIKNSSSESEFSDIDSQVSRTKSLHASIRQNAYHALQAAVRIIDQKTMFSYWSSFIPDLPSIPRLHSNQTIFTTILKDPVQQVRLSALTLLIEMLQGSKQYLSIADGRSAKHTAFTSLSSILASMISEIHRCLLLALLAENSSITLIQILKCYSVLADNVHYSKLDKSIPFKFLKHIRCFITHKDVQVQVACLSVFTSIVSSDQTPCELEDVMLSADFEKTLNILTSNSTFIDSEPLFTYDQLPWVIEVCQKNIYSDAPLPCRIQSLQLLSSVLWKYFQKLQLIFPVFEEILLFCLHDPDVTIQIRGAKLLDIIGRCLNNKSNLEESLCQKISDLFSKALTGPMTKCLTNEDHKSLQAAVCDCLSTVPATVFASLQSKLQILYISILLGLSSDSNSNVRGAAIRCLGIYSLFPCLTQDASFFEDLAMILIKAVNDPNLSVRFKASWALGNLSDALCLNQDAFLSNKQISTQLFCSVGSACVEFSKDIDRIRANAVRSLGNFLSYIPESYLNISAVQEFVKNATEVLISALSANFMKVCWNACYALKSLLKNENLIKSDIVCLEKILEALTSVLKSPNFKVRISAVQAIMSLSDRAYYGATFSLLWKQILVALQSSLENVNFKEIKHQENLCAQLCYSLCHLASLMSVEDLNDIQNDTLSMKETLLISMWKFGTHSTEEKNADVQAAIEHMTLLKGESKEIASQIEALEDIMNQAILAFHETC